MEHFEIAGNRDGYSDAFWEVRNKSIQKWLGTVLVILIILIALKVIIGFIDKNKIIKKKKRALGKVLKNTLNRLLVKSDTLNLLKHLLTDTMI